VGAPKEKRGTERFVTGGGKKVGLVAVPASKKGDPASRCEEKEGMYNHPEQTRNSQEKGRRC